ncbi:S41 family peptidase [Longimicrobium terrae]|uniref:Carboxyl-terminal processing protease n=1 Tax=Longimicrobium terrae TaxID=1639882 RepID=A0A841H4G0_9BACT|nr:S41 family peptidase [Longimicrobium terrae]MBB4638772.1 carboxyl-terminal processing protease [Longimicrobium terrae]MBB6073011.1 carboxyl-terminal processing protease [Longimicrobium terrae]NNC33135.1 S41 family peptidase [Longimicrobium terrae]
MKLKRTVVAPALVAGVALVSGGWLLQHGVQSDQSVFAQARLFDEVMNYVENRYVEPQSSADLYDKAIKGLLQELGDPHTTFMSADEYAQLHLQTSGEYGGLGIQISSRDGWVTAVGVLPETPAERAGVRVGDRFVEIGGKSAQGWTDDQAVKELRGPRGTPVTIRMQRVGVDQPISFTLTREQIHVRSVPYAYMLSPGIGYASLVMFSETSTEELRGAIEKLRGEGMRSLVLDLRGNPGGLLDQGIGVADLFLKPNQPVVETRARDPRESETFRARTEESYDGLTVAVLVDAYSASAAEIVAGALQDHDRAVVLGTTSYGKGSVQSLFPLSGGNFLKMTTAKWYTPAGRSIQRDHSAQAEDDEAADTDSAAVGADGNPVTTDSTRRVPYRTDSGRTVYGGGGIVPDMVVRQDTANAAEKEFIRIASRNAAKYQDALFGYSVAYERAHPELRQDFAVTPEMRRAFYDRLQAAGVTMTWETFQGAQRFTDAQLTGEIARSKFGPSVAAVRDDATDRVLQEAIRLLRAAPNQAALLRAVQQAQPVTAARGR